MWTLKWGHQHMIHTLSYGQLTRMLLVGLNSHYTAGSNAVLSYRLRDVQTIEKFWNLWVFIHPNKTINSWVLFLGTMDKYLGNKFFKLPVIVITWYSTGAIIQCTTTKSISEDHRMLWSDSLWIHSGYWPGREISGPINGGSCIWSTSQLVCVSECHLH